MIVEGILFPIHGFSGRSRLVLISLLLRQRAGQEPEGNAGDEEEAGRHQKAHPPGAHPAGIFRRDGHTVWMEKKMYRFEGLR